MMSRFRFRPHWNSEAVIWMIALVVLAVLPVGTNDHITFCVPTLLGAGECWGCGIGESIGLFLRGHLEESIQAHMAGPLASIVLLARIGSLIFRQQHL